ncbi:amidase signature domain-containing protein [Apodospora peruviana]|uniref:Amidase signature domain-containing protein n=1 Tax=Apodospora peruviana TaxID=516989 RepID=A0AAE0IT07_9PEZI|nr:amidase signature domain-containing protein [Apodospora peruviana]
MVRLSGLSILWIVSAVAAQLASTGLSVTLNNVPYFISPYSAGKVSVDTRSLSKVATVFGFKPVTVVPDAKESDLPKLLTSWTSVDDVFQPAFAGAILLGSARGTSNPKKPIISGVSSVVVKLSNKKIPAGPYFLELSTGSLYPVHRLYQDFAGAFLQALLEKPDGKFETLSAQIAGSDSLTIGVPSRLYYTKTAAKPLAGVRLGVKDIYRVAGVKGSNGNRAWYNLYPAANVTGTAIQRLIDAGAVVVGLQKTSQFANGESATADWVDYHEPFNPRGDGYQDTSSSSSGAGASVASYEWLDIAIGSDTGGSVRGPAGTQGLFGNRPSHGLVSLDNVMPLSPTLDTPGFLIRDPYIWDAANAALYGKNYKSLVKAKPKYPNKILTVGFPTNTSASAAAPLFIDFANALAKFVSGSVTALNLENEWKATGPGGPALAQLLNQTYATIITKEQTELVREPFFRDYAAAHDGRTPFVNPVPKSRWAYGDNRTDADLQQEYKNKQTFMTWWNTKVLPPVTDASQCSSGLLLYPGSSGSQNPRNTYRTLPGVPLGFGTSRISVFTEVPDSVYPLGQVASLSTITNHVEYFPVAVDIMAAKGCDGLLVKLAQDLVQAGILTVPKAGGTVTGGDILMK